MLRSTSVVITTIGASPLIALSPVRSPTRSVAVRPHEVAVLLVRQRLQRRRVEGLRALRERARDRVLGDERLARPGRRRDEHGPALVERVERARLERVQGKRPLRRERRPNFGGRHRPLVVGAATVVGVGRHRVGTVVAGFTVVPVVRAVVVVIPWPWSAWSGS